ncbi:MAG: aldose epimerase family protein [Rikenellaceae bacterium]
MKISSLATITLFAASIFSCAEPKQVSDIVIYPKTNFDTVVDGKNISIYTLKNSSGTTAQITNFGARIVSLWTADRDGKFDDITLGYSNIDSYINFKGIKVMGAALGRFANRIGGGEITIDNTTYPLTKNDGGKNHLHGGNKSFDLAIWEVVESSDSTLTLSYLSKDMEEGFPGNLQTEIRYSLTEENALVLEYSAVTDRPTVLNLANHAFFNLKGEGSGTIYDHILELNADRYVEVNDELLPSGKLLSVEATPLDFRVATTIGERIVSGEIEKGYDHCYYVNNSAYSDVNEQNIPVEKRVEFVARVSEPTSGRVLELYSSEPGVQLYTSNFFDGSISGKSGKKYNPHESFALESQHLPDSPNHTNFPTTLLRPEQVYHQITKFVFK